MMTEGVVSDTGLAQSPALEDPPQGQTAPLLVSRDGQLGVRLCDEAGFIDGDERYTQRIELNTVPNVLVAQLAVLDRPGKFLQCFGFSADTGSGYYYLQIHDKKALTGAEVPKFELPIAKDRGIIAVNFSQKMTTGLVIGLSSTQGTFTGVAKMVCAVKALAGGG